MCFIYQKTNEHRRSATLITKVREELCRTKYSRHITTIISTVVRRTNAPTENFWFLENCFLDELSESLKKR